MVQTSHHDSPEPDRFPLVYWTAQPCFVAWLSLRRLFAQLQRSTGEQVVEVPIPGANHLFSEAIRSTVDWFNTIIEQQLLTNTNPNQSTKIADHLEQN